MYSLAAVLALCTIIVAVFAFWPSQIVSADTLITSYNMDIFPAHGGYTQSQCWNESGSHVISSNVSYILMSPTGGPTSSNVNAVISDQGGSISLAKITITNSSGAVIYQSPSNVDIGSNVYTNYDQFGWSSTWYRWPDAPRRVDLPASGAPYTISTQGSGCNGWSSNFLTTWAGMLVSEYDRCPTTSPAPWANGRLIYSGGTYRVNTQGYNFCIANSSGYNYFVPVATPAELAAFVNRIPYLTGLTTF